jgi:hypothetical protein
MPRVAVREAVPFLVDLTPFSSNGEFRGLIDSESRFVVYSYSTPIWVVEQDGETAHLNAQRYSVTTSRHQNLVRHAIRRRVETETLTHETPEAFEEATGYRVRKAVSHY